MDCFRPFDNFEYLQLTTYAFVILHCHYTQHTESGISTLVTTILKGSLLVLSLVVSLASPLYAATTGEIKTGSQLREADLLSFDGMINKLSDYKGKPLIINVWASWCGPCRDEMPSLDYLARHYGSDRLNIIGVSTDDNVIAAYNFIVKSKVSFKNYIDRNLMLENMLGANRIPLTILIDSNGVVLQKIRGSRDWSDPAIIKHLDKVFKSAQHTK